MTVRILFVSVRSLPISVMPHVAAGRSCSDKLFLKARAGEMGLSDIVQDWRGLSLL